jgi:ABC-type branched-subunit amino acid transport system substrate-binding protein
MKTWFPLLILMFTGFFSFSQDKIQDPNYGNTPAELVPYGKYQDPYLKFFIEPKEFLGTGREKSLANLPETVKIGFLGPLERTGDLEIGKQMLQGAKLALEEANQDGGFRGIPFELMLHNDAGLWGAAANEVVKMYDEGVWAILGSIDGTVTHVALRVALKVEIPMINTGDSDPTLTETSIPWIIRVIGDDRQSSYALANYMITRKGHSKIAVLRVNDRYGRVGIGEFRDSARRLGFPLVLEVRYTPGDSTFTAQLNRVRKSGADALLIWPGDAETAVKILNEIDQMDLDLPIYCSDRVVRKEFIEMAGPLAEGIVTTYSYNPVLNDPKLKAFNKRYSDRFGMEPDTFAAHAYDGMNITIAAIRQAGLNRTLIRDLLTDLKTFQGYQGVTGEIILDASWNDIGPIWMVDIRDGDFVFSPAPDFKKNEAQ